MRAALITGFGMSPRTVDRRDPVAGDGERVIQVLASAINPIDLAVSSGHFYGGNPPLPHVPGAEAVGRPIAPDGTPTEELVYVAGAGFGNKRSGGLAELATAPAGSITALSAGTDPVAAVALGIAGLAGWLPLAWRAPIRPEDHVLILGATGIVGQVAVQAARLLGAAHIVGAGRRPDALEASRALGADAIVTLDTDDVGELAARFREASGGDGPTYVFDPLWGVPVAAALAAAAPGARIVNLGQGAGADATVTSSAVRGKQLEIYGYLNFAVPIAVREDGHRHLLEHAAAARLRVPVQTIGMDGIGEGWERQQRGTDRKLVVVPGHDGPPADAVIGGAA